MRVSVNIVSASSVTVQQPDIINLSEGYNLSKGTVLLGGADHVLVNISGKVKVVNRYGDEKSLDVISKKVKDVHYNISYEGIGDIREWKGIYKGTLTTTVEYL